MIENFNKISVGQDGKWNASKNAAKTGSERHIIVEEIGNGILLVLFLVCFACKAEVECSFSVLVLI